MQARPERLDKAIDENELQIRELAAQAQKYTANYSKSSTEQKASLLRAF
jgi:hypothetical protein